MHSTFIVSPSCVSETKPRFQNLDHLPWVMYTRATSACSGSFPRSRQSPLPLSTTPFPEKCPAYSCTVPDAGRVKPVSPPLHKINTAARVRKGNFTIPPPTFETWLVATSNLSLPERDIRKLTGNQSPLHGHC